MAASFGKMPTTSVLRLISPLRRSSGFVECSLVRYWGGKVMEAKTSASLSSTRVASLGTLGRIWSDQSNLHSDYAKTHTVVYAGALVEGSRCLIGTTFGSS